MKNFHILPFFSVDNIEIIVLKSLVTRNVSCILGGETREHKRIFCVVSYCNTVLPFFDSSSSRWNQILKAFNNKFEF
jgi:hypothetical protein